MDTKTPMGGLKSYFPILDWLSHYKSEWLRFDIIAALSVWALLVPQSIAYSSIAAVSGSVITLWAAAGTNEWIAYTATVAVFAGLVYIVLGVLKMGWLSRFLSGAVLGGFVFGFGIGLILLLLFRRSLPKLPRTIIVVVIGILVSDLMGLEKYGVSIVGPIPTSHPSFVWPTLPPVSLTAIVLGSPAIIFIGYSESLAAAKEEGSKYDYEIDASQEMVAQGTANAASGLLGGYAVEGSLSKTTIADIAGQKTQLASLLTAGLIPLTILFLTGFFTTLPIAVLGAVVIDAGISLVKIKEFQHYRLSNRDPRSIILCQCG